MTIKQKTRVAKAREASNPMGRQARCVRFSHDRYRCCHVLTTASTGAAVAGTPRESSGGATSPNAVLNTITDCACSICTSLIGFVTIARTETRVSACTRTRISLV
jgi:hypothetical protein